MNGATRLRNRAVAVSLAIAATMVGPGSVALGEVQVARTGSPGDWAVTDTLALPGARCSYAGVGTAGGSYLIGIRPRYPVEMMGTTHSYRSVAYRPIIQHRIDGTCTTVKRGVLCSGNASLLDPVLLAPGLTTFGALEQPGQPFRLLVKLIWYRADASVKGTRLIRFERYLQRDGSLGARCPGFVADV